MLKKANAPLWTITPKGESRARSFLDSIDLPTLISSPVGGAEFGHGHHLVIPAELAPPKWVPYILRFLDDFPFDMNIFCMTRFPRADVSDDDVPLRDAIEVMRKCVQSHGLVMHLASDRQIVDDILGNVAAHMWACKFGVGIIENRASRGLNYNTVIELGAMLMAGRRCAILKDLSAPQLPTDLAGQIYKPIDLADLNAVEEVMQIWLAEDIGVTPRH